MQDKEGHLPSKEIRNRYRQDLVWEWHNSLYEEDSDHKFSTLRPYLDTFAEVHSGNHAVILDVGGGAGEILRSVDQHLSSRAVRTCTFALDLSPKALREQLTRNPHLQGAVLGSVEQMPFRTESVDLTLLVDVLEHVPDLKASLDEIRRVSAFALIEIPLEKNLFVWLVNLVTRGSYNRNLRDKVGHITRFSHRAAANTFRAHLGEIIRSEFTNTFLYNLRCRRDRYSGWKKIADWAANLLGVLLNALSPKLASILLYDFQVVLVRCVGHKRRR